MSIYLILRSRCPLGEIVIQGRTSSYSHFEKDEVLELVVIESTEFLASPKVRNRYPGTYQLLTPTFKKEGVLELVVIGLTFIIYYNKLTVLTNE